MYNELFFHDGQTGQIITPDLRSGNSHSNRWYVGILRRIIRKIREKYPKMKIIIRADSGFICPAFYSLSVKYNLFYAVGIAGNEYLKTKTKKAESIVSQLYVKNEGKHQHFMSFAYQAGSWKKEENCICKVKSRCKVLNVRYITSNIPELTAREIYTEFHVKRGDASENRIKNDNYNKMKDLLSSFQILCL